MRKRHYKLPVQYYESNLAFTTANLAFLNIPAGKECWACYKVAGFKYDFLSEDEKLLKLFKTSKVLQSVYTDAHLLSIPVSAKLTDNMNYLRGFANGEMKPIALEYVNTVEEILQLTYENEKDDYEKYLVVKLKKPRSIGDMWDIVTSSIRKPYRAVNEILGLDLVDIFEKEIESYYHLESSLKKELKININIRELDKIEMEKLMREPFWRGLASPKTRGKEKYFDAKAKKYKGQKSWEPAYKTLSINGELVRRPLKRDVISLYEGQIIRKLKHIEVYQDTIAGEIVGYQKYIVISKLPDMPFFAGTRWLYQLEQAFDFPLMWSIRYTKKGYEEVQKDLGTSRKQLDDQLEHDQQVDGIRTSQMHLEQDQEIDQAIYEIQSGKKPFLYATIIIGIASESLDECNSRVSLVRSHLEGLDIETQVPAGDQFNIFCETMIGSKQYATDYMIRIPPETLAGGMPFASTLIGDLFGFVIGSTGQHGKLVKFNPFRASAELDKSPSITFTGSLGLGKSTLANLIVILAAMFGAKIFIGDPKGDRNWEDELPWLKPYINKIELSTSSKFKGLLDIFLVMMKSFGKDASEEQKAEIARKAAEYELSILGALAGIDVNDERMEHLMDAVSKVSKEPNPCGMKVIETLEKFAEDESTPTASASVYARLAKNFRNIIDNSSYAHLLFGDGTEETLDITKSINILQTRALTLPAEGTNESKFTHAERTGMAVLLAVSVIGLEFSLQSRDILKIFVQDEAKVFKRSPTAQAMFTRMVSQGRTENAPIYIIGQNISDVGDESIKSNIGVKFCFGTNSMEEAANILEYLGLDKNSVELQKTIVEEFEQGICLMKDIEGRVSIIQVDLILEEFKRAFKTRTEIRTDDPEPEVETSDERTLYESEVSIRKNLKKATQAKK